MSRMSTRQRKAQQRRRAYEEMVARPELSDALDEFDTMSLYEAIKKFDLRGIETARSRAKAALRNLF